MLYSGRNVNNNIVKFSQINPKVKFSAVGLLILGILTLVVYQGNKWVEQQRILAEQKRQAELKAHRETEKKRIEAEKEALVVQLQKNKACVSCDLSGANLEGLLLEKVNLQGANLQGANLSTTQLAGANLSRANLQGNNLSDTELYSANLQDAFLLKTNLKNANLENADLSRANLEEANLDGANTVGTNFSGTRR